MEYTAVALLARMERFGIRTKKGLGQHFLWDEQVLDAIVEASSHSNLPVLEIGPGLGILTEKLAQHHPHVTAVEIDTAVFPALQETMESYSNVTLVQGDALQINLQTLMPECYTIAANLPYQITTIDGTAAAVTGMETLCGDDTARGR